MSSYRKILIISLLSMMSTLWINYTFAGQPGGLILHGRVYDGNYKFRSINDADIEINISGFEPNVNYPLNKNGEYKVKDFNVRQCHEVKIEAVHSDYVQHKEIIFRTTEYKKKKDIRMIKKNAYSEENYRKAKEINLNSSANIDKAFSLVEESINLSPRSRYYLYLADLIRKRIRLLTESDELPSRMISFIEAIEDDDGFKGFKVNTKEIFYNKIGNGFSMSKHLVSRPTGNKTCLQYALDAFNKSIEISPVSVTNYQAKYLLLRKTGNSLDAIKVIETYFETNDPVDSELVIKGFFVDWIDLIRGHTGFLGSENEIAAHKLNKDYVALWESLLKRLRQYRFYYRNPNIKGNKNIQNALITSSRIVENGE
ncbi:MAG: hypothetical protein ACQ9MH_16810 [Nitrospinales bacterium]